MRCAEDTGSSEDIKCRRIHVAGRDWHFVFGVTGHEDVVKGQFAFEKINRTDFIMYPEDVLGGCPPFWDTTPKRSKKQLGVFKHLIIQEE